ncbi:hypothetical protein [Spiroplasma endosymbiont of Stenodema calcarata]|uniref:hypothetical protein n=1 Tax=Spiroplasma endosymbiont of Stenodema calcarata TaxID=3139328 RepID=UPI003CCA9B99
MVHHKSSKPKLHRWLWIILIILLLILLAGGGGIGYEIYRISSRTNIGNSYITDDDSIVDTEDLDTKEPGHDDKDDVDKENDKNQEINISQYSFDFTKNISNLIEVDALELDLIKTKLLTLSDVSPALQTLLKQDSLKFVLEQEPELSSEKNFLVNLQLDASEVVGHTGQAVLRLEVKVKPEEIEGVINIKGIVNVYKGVNNTYETTDFRKHFEPLLKLYEKSVKFKVQAWSGNLPKLTGGIEIPQMQKDILTEALNKRFVPDFERVNIIHNGDVQNLEIYWIFTKQNQKSKVLNLSPYASGQVFAKSHFQENFKYNLKIKYTNKNI